MISRRDFIRYAGLATTFYATEAFLGFPAHSKPESDCLDVNVPEFRLRYKKKSYDVSIGKLDAQTPIGTGTIFEKIKRPVFRFNDPGPDKGKIVRYCTTEDGKVIKVPYEKMRSLGIWIYGGKKLGWTGKFRVHSTADDSRIKKLTSGGCVVLGVDDMLDLYTKVPIGTKIAIRYDTIVVHEDGFEVFADIYNKGVNTPELLEKKLKKKVALKLERDRLQNVLERCTGKYVLFSEL